MENYITKNGLQIRKKIELTSNEAVKQAVVAGLGISIMPLIGNKHELKVKDLQIISSAQLPIHSMWQITWLKSKKLNPVASAFLNYLELEKDAIVQKYFSWIKKYS